MTTLTDYLLGALAGVLGVRLLRVGAHSSQVTVRLWGMSFLCMAVGAFVGGTSHGFAGMMSTQTHTALWKITVWAIGATAALLLAATAYSCLSASRRQLLLGVATVQFAIYAIWMWSHDEFIWVIADYLPAVAIVIGFQFIAWRGGVAGAGAILLGLHTTLVGAGVQASGLALHEHFNHNDLYHVIQMAATVMLYRGAVQARDRGGD